MASLDEVENYGYRADKGEKIWTAITAILALVIGKEVQLPVWTLIVLPVLVSAMVYRWFQYLHEKEKREKESKNKAIYENKLQEIQEEWSSSSFSSDIDTDSLSTMQQKAVRHLELSSNYQDILISEIKVCKTQKQKDLIEKEKKEKSIEKHHENELAIQYEEIDLETFEALSTKFSEEINDALRSLIGFADDTIQLRLREIKNRQIGEADDTFRRPVKGGESTYHNKIKNKIKIMIDQTEAKLKFRPERYFSNSNNVHLEVTHMVLNPAALGDPDYVDFGAMVDGQYYAIECFSLENKLSDDELKAKIIDRFRDYQPEITQIVKEYGHRFFFLRFGIIYD